MTLGYIHRVARNPEFLASHRVKSSDFRYRWYLAQQPHGIEASFLQCDRVPGQWGDPGHLGFDLFYELVDLLCCELGLLLFNASE